MDWRTVLMGMAFFVAGLLARGFFVAPLKGGLYKSPLVTLIPNLSQEEKSKLPYPLDALPGARDIDTPFGSFRAYEWGPVTGKKVLLVHGISTPCLALGGVAHGLADRGCRVLLFDLPGRGYSDTPTDIQHDVRLFTSQILLVLASSPLSWTSEAGGFALVGYSLGGGISAAFTSYFPDLVNSLTLIAPAGLIRDHHISKTSRIIYSEGVIPEFILDRIVRKRLQKPLYPPKKVQSSNDEKGASDAVRAEVDIGGDQGIVLSKSHPDITIETAVNHQILNHHGFVQAFMSSIRYGPIRSEHDIWRRIGKRLTDRNARAATKEKVLIILGERDPIIVLEEIKEDASEVLDGNVDFRVLSAGHEAPIAQAEEVASLIWNHCNDDAE